MSTAALDVALAHYEARYIADDIVCDAPVGRIERGQAYRARHDPGKATAPPISRTGQPFASSTAESRLSADTIE